MLITNIDKNKITINEAQFNTAEELDEFCVFLLNLILDIKEETSESYDDAEIINEEE